ncbi:hypothetical protein BDZ94DRAFT_1266558 [Collybia nuda]|uniref:Uncharacterized protein n=1 Tax=Collybia nuda TaxID=64659 RepID=A0A9P5XYV3_9AGAR|nr:hypothetical protein BDZ94DRAFT_1266558 [Collybia nuda]
MTIRPTTNDYGLQGSDTYRLGYIWHVYFIVIITSYAFSTSETWGTEPSPGFGLEIQSITLLMATLSTFLK